MKPVYLYATADEIAYALIIAQRMCDHPLPHEKGQSVEWIATRRDRPWNARGEAAQSRIAYYALDALMDARPLAPRYALARGCGFNSAKNAIAFLKSWHSNRESWWNHSVATEIRDQLIQKIGLSPSALPPIPEPAPTFKKAKQTYSFPSALHVSELPLRRTGGIRRELTAREAQMNRDMLGDPGGVSVRLALNETSGTA